jgi:dCTP deaminase
MTDFGDESPGGIFPSQWIEQAIADGIVASDQPIAPSQIQPNSLDLRLGSIAYRVQCSLLPGREGIERKLSRFTWYSFSLPDEGRILETDQVYLIPLQERLSLPQEISGRANPKSSTGRLDVFTRVVTESGRAFDEIPAGYKGSLYLEVVPRSFPIKVRPGDCLAQVRFAVGDSQFSRAETAAILNSDDVILSSTLQPLRENELRISQGISLSVDLGRGADKAARTIGFKARKNQAPIDLRDIGKVPIRRYWERIYYDRNQPVILEPGEFYIFASRELVRLPPGICAEMLPFDAASGELRTHYAGFFDSGFGYATGQRSALTAAAVVLEIRNRDVPFLIEEDQPLFQLELLRNTTPPDRLYGAMPGSHYQNQRLKLSKQFTRTDDDADEDDATGVDGHPRLDL